MFIIMHWCPTLLLLLWTSLRGGVGNLDEDRSNTPQEEEGVSSEDGCQEGRIECPACKDSWLQLKQLKHFSCVRIPRCFFGANERRYRSTSTRARSGASSSC
jgi:hypothetical protein